MDLDKVNKIAQINRLKRLRNKATDVGYIKNIEKHINYLSSKISVVSNYEIKMAYHKDAIAMCKEHIEEQQDMINKTPKTIPNREFIVAEHICNIADYEDSITRHEAAITDINFKFFKPTPTHIVAENVSDIAAGAVVEGVLSTSTDAGTGATQSGGAAFDGAIAEGFITKDAIIDDGGVAESKDTVIDDGGVAESKDTVIDGGVAESKDTVIDDGGVAESKDTVIDDGNISDHDPAIESSEESVFSIDLQEPKIKSPEMRGRFYYDDSSSPVPSTISPNPFGPNYSGSLLINLGNTCYQNCVLYPLLNMPGEFIDDLLKGNKNLKKKNGLYYYFAKFANKFFSVNRVMKNKRWHDKVIQQNVIFADGGQHDAQEYYSFLIDTFIDNIGNKQDFIPTGKTKQLTLSQKLLNIKADTEWERFHGNKYSELVSYFSGMYYSKLTYLDSKNQSNSFAPFNIVSLIIPGIKQQVTLKDCLKYHIENELMDSDNKVKGIFSYDKTLCNKQEIFWKLPKYLTFCIKRFKYNLYGQIEGKDNRSVLYPETLDMNPYIHPDSKYYYDSNIYSLYAVSLHSGMVFGYQSFGHYTSMVKNRVSKQWFYHDDSSHPVPIDDMSKLNSDNAYLLYYVKND